MNITLIQGGQSAEAEVSRSSGAEVNAALSSRGHNVCSIELDQSLAQRLSESMHQDQIDVVFPVLHGPPGEDGTIQGLLDLMGLPYVGSGVRGSAVAMDKALAKALYRLAQLPVTSDLQFQGPFSVSSAQQQVHETFGERVVVKPNQQGSALGVSRVNTQDGLRQALESASRFEGGVIVEPFVVGMEVTVGVLDIHSAKAIALPAAEVQVAAGEWYDYNNRYAVGQSEHLIPTSLPAEVNEALQRIALVAHEVLGLRDLSRSDFLVTDEHEITLLETNTMPGMTPTSLYPDAARAAGIEFAPLMEQLIDSALKRGPRVF